MNIAIDQYLQLLDPWDLAFIYGGQTYQTRPLTLGDLAVLSEINASKPQALADAVASLFAEPKPPVATWPSETAVLIIQTVGAYAANRTKKNGPAMLANLQATTGMAIANSAIPGK